MFIQLYLFSEITLDQQKCKRLKGSIIQLTYKHF